ncbi:hypothetical protein FQN54_002786 [Arachnomyces sp. PD_36]|nr:hypothetical protein FQN54_002786 [Arachnomyces sp. PD_36]
MGSSKTNPPPFSDNPNTDNPPPPHASSSSSHSLQPYVDLPSSSSDPSPPPAYTEQDTTTPLPPPPRQPTSHPSLPDPANYLLPDSLTITHRRATTHWSSPVKRLTPTYHNNSSAQPASPSTTTLLPQTHSTTLSLSPPLSSSPSTLYNTLLTQSRLPPRLSVWVEGSHRERKTSYSSSNNQSYETVTDFKFCVDVGGTVLRGWEEEEQDGEGWRVMKVIRDGDGERAWRGGRVKSRGDTGGRVAVGGGGGFDDDAEDLEALIEGSNATTGGESDHEALRLWCERFCNDSASLKSLSLHREILNWDFPAIKAEITSLLRSLNYRGRINIFTESEHHTLTIQTPHWVNRARANPFIWWCCVILQLWVITWPILLLMERKYSPLKSQWFTSRPDPSSYNPTTLSYTRTFARGLDEKAWVAYWANAIKEAALTRRRDGEVVGEGDVERLARSGGDGVEVLRRAEMEADWERRGRGIRGESGWRDVLTGVWRGLVGGRREGEWDQVRGWGGDR